MTDNGKEVEYAKCKCCGKRIVADARKHYRLVWNGKVEWTCRECEEAGYTRTRRAMNPPDPDNKQYRD